MTLAQMREAYEAGRSAQWIADRCGRSETTVRNTLRTLGVTIRPTGTPKGQTHLPYDEVVRTVALYREHGAVEAGRILGIHPWTVRWRIRSVGERLDERRRLSVPPIPDGFVDVRRAGEALGITPVAVEKRCRRGTIAGATREERWPGRWLIPVSRIAEAER